MLTYLLDVAGAGGHCRVRVLGELTEDNMRSMLDRLWSDPVYGQQATAAWDLGDCQLPELNALMRIAEFIATHKQGRGPQVLAFVSPAFGEALLARTFRSFERLLKLNLNFFATEAAAVAWLDERRPRDG
ncbi:MAG: hypothetical protein RLW62_13605 [Gammaproteobacteria bacterium]